MAAAVGLAFLFPEPGAQGGALRPELLNKVAVALIFFLHGLTLAPAALRAGTLLWPLHLVVQGSTFVLFPLLGVVLAWLVGPWLAPDLVLGFFFLCALPSTVSSSVALTAAAGGNVAGAVFNATLSNLIGVVLTPLWLAWWTQGSGASLPLADVVLDLVRWLLLPLAVGQLARPWLGALASRHQARVRVVDRLTILLLVYTSFCDSVARGVWSEHGWAVLAQTLAGAATLLGTVLALTWWVTGIAGFRRADRIAAVFCGSKKTLASGVPMARILFGAHAGLGLVLLPILVYHSLQLVVCGVLAGRWARAADDGLSPA